MLSSQLLDEEDCGYFREVEVLDDKADGFGEYMPVFENLGIVLFD